MIPLSYHECWWPRPDAMWLITTQHIIRKWSNSSESSEGSFLPTEHLDVIECGVILQRSQLLETQLLTASIETVGAVDANVVVVAPGPILHRTQPWRALWEEHMFLNDWCLQLQIFPSLKERFSGLPKWWEAATLTLIPDGTGKQTQ